LVHQKYQRKIEAEVYKTPIEKQLAYSIRWSKRTLSKKGEVKEYYSELTDIASKLYRRGD
jgi:hypothetical protein